MGYIAVKCPGCGADIQLDDSREYGYCTYCGRQVVREKIIVEHRVKGAVSEQSLMERATLFLGQRDFDEAKSYFEKALDLNPKNGKAYLGKLFCQMKVTSLEEAEESEKALEKYENYHLALKFLPETEKAKLEEINEKTLYTHRLKYGELTQRLEYEKGVMEKIKKDNTIFGGIDGACKWVVAAFAVIFLIYFANGQSKMAMCCVIGVAIFLAVKGLVYKKAKDAKEAAMPQDFLLGGLENQIRDLEREVDSLE